MISTPRYVSTVTENCTVNSFNLNLHALLTLTIVCLKLPVACRLYIYMGWAGHFCKIYFNSKKQVIAQGIH